MVCFYLCWSACVSVNHMILSSLIYLSLKHFYFTYVQFLFFLFLSISFPYCILFESGVSIFGLSVFFFSVFFLLCINEKITIVTRTFRTSRRKSSDGPNDFYSAVHVGSTVITAHEERVYLKQKQIIDLKQLYPHNHLL